MSEVWIRERDLALYQNELAFGDGLPVVAGYLRVSSDIQVDEGYSLETQPIYIRDACSRRFAEGYHILWISDEGVSGTLPYKRDGLNAGQYRAGLTVVTELMAMGLVQYLCVYKCNRLCRSLRVWLELDEDYLQRYGVEFFSATEPVGGRSSAGKFIADLLMASAGFERDQIAQVTQHGRDRRRAEGYIPGGGVSYGWQWDDSPRLPRGQRRNIRPVPEQAEVVRKMIRWFLSGRGITWIDKELERSGVPTPDGNTRWGYQSTLNILMNPVHCGFVRNQRGELMRGAHYDLRIIKESTYWAVVQRREETATTSTSRRRPSHGIFVELGRCGVCGMRIRVKTFKRQEPRYECRAQYSGYGHKCYGVSIEDVDRWVTQCIRDTFASPELQALSVRELRRIQDENSDGLEADQAQIQSDIERNNEESRKWDKLYSSGAIDHATYDIYAEELARESETLQTRLADTARQLERGSVKQARLELAIEILGEFDDAFEALDRDEKLGLAWNVIDELVFKPQDDHVDVHLRLICGGAHLLQLPVFGRWATRTSELSADVLTTAHCLIHGYSSQDVADMRCIALDDIRDHVRSIKSATHANTKAEALRRVGPIIDERRSELLIGQISPANELKKCEIRLLRILATGNSRHEAASELDCSILDIDRLLRSICKKFEVSRTKEALAVSLDRGLVDQVITRGKRPTENELAYLRDIAVGKPRSQMAAERGIQQRCIKARFSKMYRKFGITGVDGLLRLFREKGWL